MAKITVKDVDVTIFKINQDDYISLTDMLKAKDGDFFVTDWLRNRNTLEYIGLWESVYNPGFNYGEFAIIKSQSGLNRFKISVNEFAARTRAIGILAKTGKYGGTFAHKDIAFKFANWISVEFEFYIVKEYQRLKADENKRNEWSAKRDLAKINYHIHTSAISRNLIPARLTKQQINYIYASEADVLNMALFGMTAKEWREQNPELQGNMRDYAEIKQLICLSNLENLNSVLINDGMPQNERLEKLNQIAIQQMTLIENAGTKLLE